MNRTESLSLDPAAWSAPPDVARWQLSAFAVGAIGSAASIAGFALDSQQFYRSYLVAWLFWLGVALGSLALMMIHHLSRGAWGLPVRRIFEAATRTLPFLALLCLPMLFALPKLFKWAKPEVVAADELIAKKVGYLNAPFFQLRTAIFFAILGGLVFVLNRWSARQDRSADPGLFTRMQKASGLGLCLFVLVGTFAATDWLMSLDPHWYSSLYGLIFITGQGIAALCFAILIAFLLAGRAPMAAVLSTKHFHDYGKLLLAFVMFWTYLSISQYIIIWQANLPEEVLWYLHRLHGGWQWIAGALIVLHFFFPFLLLLSRSLKKRMAALAGVALLLFVMRWLDLFWQAAPNFHHEQLTVHWLDLATTVGIGGLWVGLFFRGLAGRALLPVHDPSLKEALGHG